MTSKPFSKRVLVLFILLLSFSPFAQTFAQGITGTVTDWTGEPVIGVSIRIQGTSIGTISDFDGNYTIFAMPNDTLVFSYIGMKTLKVRVGSFNSVINVRLQDDAFGFDISQGYPGINIPKIDYRATRPRYSHLYNMTEYSPINLPGKPTRYRPGRT